MYFTIYLILLLIFIQQSSGQGSFTTVCDNTVLSNGGETGGICYEVNTGQNLNWSSANAFCTANGGRLARILNEEISIEIHRIIQGREDSHYWIGLSRVDNTSEFQQWSDGTGLEYENWRNGQPNTSNNCVTVRNNRGNWVSRDCTIEIPYICEKDVCEGWTVRDGICYKKFNDYVWAADAAAVCESQNSYLAEIPNIYVNNVILEIIDGDRCHIGLRTDGSIYYWRIGDFSLGDDTPSVGDRNRFGIIGEGREDRWNLLYSSTEVKIVCMIGPLRIEAPTQMCNDSPADTHVYEGVCYTRIIANSKNLDIATLTCNNYNGILYTFDNATLNVELRTIFGSGDDIKISYPKPEPTLRSIFSPNLFVPQEGYFNLYTGRLRPNYLDNPGCLDIDANGTLQYISCNNIEKVNYICISAIDENPTQSTTTPEKMTTTTTTTTTTTEQNPGSEDEICSSESIDGVCGIINNQTYDPNGNGLLSEKEEFLKELSEKIFVETGRVVRNIKETFGAEIVIAGINSRIDTNITTGNLTVEFKKGSFAKNTVITSAVYFDNDGYTNSSVEIGSDIITILSSEELTGEITIVFSFSIEPGQTPTCSALITENNTWSTEGITTDINSNGNGSVECTTSHITTFAVLVSTASQCEIQMSEIPKLLLQITSYTFLSISLLFLLTSLLIFMFSGKKFFRIDINVMHFNHTVSILLAIFVFIFGAELFAEYPVVCTIVAFLLHFLWINVFMSSLGIAILLIYSIWIVGLKIPRKLSPALIPICWSVSFIWAGIWIIYGKFVAMGYLDSEIEYESTNKKCKDPCFISTRANLIWTFLVPIFVVLFVNIIILILVLFKIRIGLKRKNKNQSELMRVRKLALGAIVLVPTLSLPFIVSLPLAFLKYYHGNQFISTIFICAFVFSTTPIGIVHFFLVTYRIPEAKFPKFCTKHSLRESTAVTTVDTLKSTLPRSNENGNNTLKLNVRRPIAKVPSIVIVDDCIETLC